MSRIRIIMLSLLAVLSVSAVASATAQAECSGTAPEHKCVWEVKEVGGAFRELASGEEALVRSEGSPEAATFILTAGTHKVTCKKIVIIADIIGGKPGTDVSDRILFTECSTNSTTTGCKVKSKGNTAGGEILVIKIRTKLVEREKAGVKNILSDNFEQRLVNGTKEFVTLEFGTTEETKEAGTRFEHKVLTGACAGFPGSTKVKGNIAAKVNGEELEFPSPELSGNTLEAFGEAAKLEGKVKTRLEEPGEFRAA